MEVIDIVKSKIPLLLPTDDVLNAYIEEVGQSIMTYCNREDIPKELRFVHANMVVDLIAGIARKNEPDSQVSVKSIKEGDVSVELGTIQLDSKERSTEKLLFDYSKQLNSYRKLRW